MWCGVVTLFPAMFDIFLKHGITGRAVEKGLMTLSQWNPRDYTEDVHHTVDDRPYGGGPGMVLQVAPLRAAIQAARVAAGGEARVIYLSPQGRKLDTSLVRQVVSDNEKLIFLAGRYEGVDERLITLEVDEEWSIGDYVLSGGELAVMVALDAMVRWIPGALGHEGSASEDSFVDGLLDCPHYTRPEVVEGLAVPEVLLSGDHQAIARWRLKQKLGRTWLKRPDLLNDRLSEVHQALLMEFIEEYERSLS